jgi:general stress protein YciG
MPKHQDHLCKAKTKTGKPCRAAATAGGLCFFHANPNRASELGRKGGRKNRHLAAESVDPLPRLDTAKAVRDTVDRLIADVYSGKVEPRVASGLAPLLNLQFRVIEVTDLERRMGKLERLLAEPMEGSANDGNASPADLPGSGKA